MGHPQRKGDKVMNKKQLAGKLASREKLTRAKAERVLDSALGIITEELIAKKKVRLVGFGKKMMMVNLIE